MDIADIAKYHSAIGSTIAGNGHDHRVQADDDVCHFRICVEQLPI
jgi:hypothetical protein